MGFAFKDLSSFNVTQLIRLGHLVSNRYQPVHTICPSILTKSLLMFEVARTFKISNMPSSLLISINIRQFYNINLARILGPSIYKGKVSTMSTSINVSRTLQIEPHIPCINFILHLHLRTLARHLIMTIIQRFDFIMVALDCRILYNY